MMNTVFPIQQDNQISNDLQPKATPDDPFYRTILMNNKADWNRFRSYMVETLLSTFLKTENPELPLSSLNGSLEWAWKMSSTRKECQQKPDSRLWVMPECAAAKSHCIHYYNSYHWSSQRFAAFRTACNLCKRVLENVKCSYAQAVNAKAERKRLESRKFWKISNKTLNRTKASLHKTPLRLFRQIRLNCSQVTLPLITR